MTEQPTGEHLCVVCPQLRKGEPRTYDRAQACTACRVGLDDLLGDIPGSYGKLDDNLERGVGAGQRVRGGEVEAPLPFREDVWDLLLPARIEAISDTNGDQVGYISVATVLHTWVRDWCDIRGRGELGAAGNVWRMTTWLRDRLEWACDEHPAVDEFAREIRDLDRALRRFVGADDARPQPCVGVPCRRCDLKTLAKLSDGSGDVECQNVACRAIYGAEDYSRWVRLVSASTRKRVGA